MRILFLDISTPNSKIFSGFFTACNGLSISEEQLQQVVKLSGVLRITNKYLENDFKKRCAELAEQPGDLDAKD